MVNEDTIEIRWMFAVIRRWLWLILGVTFFIVVAAYEITAIMPPVYEASALLLVNPSKNSNESQYNNLMAGTQLALTYSKMVTDRPVLEKVISTLGLSQSPEELANQITAVPVSSSQIIKLTVEDSDPFQAALIANALAQAFTERVQVLSTQRYAGAMVNAKGQMEELQAQMADLQSQIDVIQEQKVTKDIAQANQQTDLASLQSNYQSLQNSFRNLQLKVADVNGEVHVVEPVQVQQGSASDLSYAVSVISIDQGQSISLGNDQIDPLMLSYAQMLTKTSILDEVIKEVDLLITPEQINRMVSYEVIPGTRLIRITVENADEQNAIFIAKSLVNHFMAQVRAVLVEPYSNQVESMQQQLSDIQASINSTQAEIGTLTSEIAQMTAKLDRLNADLTAARGDYRSALQNYEQLQTTSTQSSNSVILTNPAQPPNQSSRNRMLYLMIAVVLGLAMGSGTAFLMENVHAKIRSDQDVRSILQLPVLSTIGKINKKKELVMYSASESTTAEDFRILGNKVRLIHENAMVNIFMITSPVPTEGKSVLVSNLAISLSKMGLQVILVDADLRLPRLHKIFGLNQQNGLTTILNGAVSTGPYKIRIPSG